MEIELTNPSLTFEFGNQGGSIQQIQSDWEQTDDTKVDYIKNKPTIPSLDRYIKSVIVTDTETVFFDQDDNWQEFRPRVAYYVDYGHPDYLSAYEAFVYNLLVYTFDGTRYYQAQSVGNNKIRFVAIESLSSSVYIHERVLGSDGRWDFAQPKEVPYAPDWPDRTTVFVLTWHNEQFEWVPKDLL